MKLKIRVNKKDLIAFVIFGIVLFFLVGLGIINITTFGGTGQLHGFNPIPIFTDGYFWETLLITIIILAVIISGVSSKIFERDKGVGLKVGQKEEKNYSHWLDAKEMKKELKMVLPSSPTSQYAGIPLINDGKKIWVDDGEYHNLIIGSTGSGKTEMLVQPMVKILAKNGESMIITDPKGEIYENNAVELREKGYNVVLLNFREPQKGNCWNPMTLPYQLYKEGNIDKASELVDDLALNILYDESSKGQDPFWEKTSADYFAGCTLGLFDDAEEEEININSISLMTTVGEDKIGPSTYIKEYFTKKSPTSNAFISASSAINAPKDTKDSILSVFRQKIRLFAARDNLSEMLSRSDFDMKDIGRKKTAVFIVIQDEKKTYHSLATIFIKQCYETLIDVAQEMGGKLPYRTNFILDEFANMPPLKDVTTMVTAARSRKIRFNFIIQNFAQLNSVYGKEDAETIRGNCGNIVYLISTELSALEEISKLCGEKKSKEKDKTASTPLVTVSDLQRLKRWSIIVLRLRKMPFKTVMTPNFQLEKNNSWGKKYPKASYPNREKGVVKVFDLKKFVDRQRDEKISKMLDELEGNDGSQVKKEPTMPPFGFGGMAPNNNFDVDSLVKKIDAKIAELEEEERLEKEAAKVKQDIVSPKPSAVENFKVTEKPNVVTPLPTKVEEPAKPEKETTTFDHNYVTDDQLFDDFFSDDDF